MGHVAPNVCGVPILKSRRPGIGTVLVGIPSGLVVGRKIRRRCRDSGARREGLGRTCGLPASERRKGWESVKGFPPDDVMSSVLV
jgi:hypothetical protein